MSLIKDVFAFNQHWRDQWVSRVVKNVVAPGSKVLDLAAGTCPYRDLFADCEYKTQDFTQLDATQNLGQKSYGAIDYVCDVTAVPVPDQSFEVVICTEALEHVPDPEAVIREIARLLRPGGKVILTAPLGSGLHQEPFHYFGGFTPHWYRRVLALHGFAEPTIEANAGSFKHLGQEMGRFARMSAPWRLSAPWWVKAAWAPLWVTSAAFLGVAMPLVCHVLDRYDRDQAFTVGYHVLAIKR